MPHSDRITLKKQKYHSDPGPHLKQFFKIRYFWILSCYYIILTSEKLNGAIISHFKQTIIKYIWELNQNCIYIYIYTELAPKLTLMPSVAKLVGALVSRSRVTKSIPSRRSWNCIFRNCLWLGIKYAYLSDTQIYILLKKTLSTSSTYA